MNDYHPPEELLPPNSVAAEEALLGAILINPEAMVDVIAFLSPNDFYILRNSWLWEAMIRLHERSESIDNLTLAEELRAMGQLDDAGGSAYITYLINNTPTSLHAEVYGRMIERTAIRRRILEAAGDIAKLANTDDADINQVIDRAEATLFAVTERRSKRDLISIRDALSTYFDQIEYRYEHRDEPVGIPTGFTDVDRLLGGLQKSDLLILAARPGMGKTSLVLNVMLNAARIGSARVAMFSLEMSNEQLVQRLIAAETGINSQKLRLGQLDEHEWNLFIQAAGTLGNLSIYLDDTPAITPLQMRGKCRRLYREHGLDLIIVDYLQLMSSTGMGRSENRVQEVSTISRNLKELARELNVPLIAASQLSRAVEQRGDKRPVLSDLRESGCLTGDTLITLADDNRPVRMIDLMGQQDIAVWAVNPDTLRPERAIISHAFSTGIKPVYRMTTAQGQVIRATANHKFLTPNGWKRLDSITIREQVMTLAEGWQPVVGLDPDGTEPVFDLTVPALHNFSANGIIAHNSIEQDADIVMFIYRDEVYNEDTDRPNEADLIVAKHRNGPIGSVTLYFKKELTQFTNLARADIDLSGF